MAQEAIPCHHQSIANDEAYVNVKCNSQRLFTQCCLNNHTVGFCRFWVGEAGFLFSLHDFLWQKVILNAMKGGNGG
jgi:hypothetical protein